MLKYSTSSPYKELVVCTICVSLVCFCMCAVAQILLTVHRCSNFPHVKINSIVYIILPKYLFSHLPNMEIHHQLQQKELFSAITCGMKQAEII